MHNTNLLNNFPSEMKVQPHWVGFKINWDEDRAKFLKIPHDPHTGGLASSTNPATWGTLEQVLNAGYEHAAYCLTHEDPYVVIDLDDHEHNPATEEDKERFNQILTTFDTYTEKSWNGKGYHVWCRGTIPSSVQRNNVEVYIAPHFIICTGNVTRASPVNDYQDLLLGMYNQMRPELAGTPGHVDSIPSGQNDDEILGRMQRAINWPEIDSLWQGLWKQDYQSQSEADLALFSHILFYTQEHEQAKRLFRRSQLGTREKAVQNDKYVDRTIQRILKNDPMLTVNIDAIIEQAKKVQDNFHAVQPKVEAAPEGAQSFPPGLIGEIAQYIFDTSSRPVREVALAGAIAFVAGMAGRSYNISGTGLNHYLVLLATTGIGKEEATSGIERIVNAVRETTPVIDRVVGPSAFASGQAIVKVLDDRPCFVSLLGEFGLTLQAMCSPKAPSHQVLMRKVLLDLYSKSGHGRVLRSSVYADSERNTKTVSSPSLSLLGDSTPHAFYAGLDQSHIAEGLIPRFIIIEAKGKRPARNKHAFSPPAQSLIDQVVALLTTCMNAEQKESAHIISMDEGATALLDKFDTEVDARINSSENDVFMQVWNRAHLKALKMAGLIATGANPFNPIVTLEHATWAIEFIRKDISALTIRNEEGEMQGDHVKQVLELERVINDYFETSRHALAIYGVTKQMQDDRVITYDMLYRRASRLATFKDKNRSPAQLVKEAIQLLEEQDRLIELPRNTMLDRYKSRRTAYVIQAQ